MVIFGINLPQRGITPYAFIKKFCLGREPQDRTLMPNFTVVALKMWPCGPKMVIFGKNLPLGKNSGVNR